MTADEVVHSVVEDADVMVSAALVFETAEVLVAVVALLVADSDFESDMLSVLVTFGSGMVVVSDTLVSDILVTSDAMVLSVLVDSDVGGLVVLVPEILSRVAVSPTVLLDSEVVVSELRSSGTVVALGVAVAEEVVLWLLSAVIIDMVSELVSVPMLLCLELVDSEAVMDVVLLSEVVDEALSSEVLVASERVVISVAVTALDAVAVLSSELENVLAFEAVLEAVRSEVVAVVASEELASTVFASEVVDVVLGIVVLSAGVTVGDISDAVVEVTSVIAVVLASEVVVKDSADAVVLL